MKLVQDKITIITGGTRGIGFAAAKIFIENGAKVSIFGETQEEVDTALAQLKELYPEEEVLGFAPDLTSRDAVMAAVGTVAQKYGRLDVMINNAGITMNTVFSRVSEEDFKHIMDINVIGVFRRMVCLPVHERGKAGRYHQYGFCYRNLWILIRNRLSYQQGRRDRPDSWSWKRDYP